MNKNLIPAILVLALLAAPACIPSPPEGASGSLAMIPFVDENSRIRGNAPLEGWSDQAALIQESVPGTADELVASIAQQTDLIRLPRSTGTYAGAHLTWHLYSFATQLTDVGPGIYQVDLALAEMEDGTGYYMVALVAKAATYEDHQAQYQAVLQHALYALEPL